MHAGASADFGFRGLGNPRLKHVAGDLRGQGAEKQTSVGSVSIPKSLGRGAAGNASCIRDPYLAGKGAVAGGAGVLSGDGCKEKVGA